MPALLAPGLSIRCEICGAWHTLQHDAIESTPYANEMLYFECRGGRYYAGQAGDPSRHQARGGHEVGAHCPACTQPIAQLVSFEDWTITMACPCGHRWSWMAEHVVRA